MKLARKRSPVERPRKAGDMLHRAEPEDDFDPTEWAEFEGSFKAQVSDAEFDPMTETPYGSAMHLAETYYLLHPKQKERIAKFIPEAAVKRDVLYSLKKGYPCIPAQYKIFFPEGITSLAVEESWPKVQAWIQKLSGSRSYDSYLESVVAAVRLFPEKRDEIQKTSEYWLDRVHGMQDYPDSYVKICAQIVLLFPSVQTHIQEFMRRISEAERSRKAFSSPDFGMQAAFKINAGDVTLQPDGTFQFAQQNKFKGPELPARPEV